MMTLTALAMTAWCLLGQTPPAEVPLSEQRAVVLPLHLPDNASDDLRAAAAGIERALIDALARHAPFHVISRTEMVAVAGRALQDQLMGCDAEGCMAEIADALGAELVVASRMEQAGGLWNLQATLLDRHKAKALRRAGIKARALDNLLASLDQVARQLASGTSISAEDPRLPDRLGTTGDVVKEYKAATQGKAETDLVESWTDFIIARNAEREWHAALEGSILLGTGIFMALYFLVVAPLGLIYGYAQIHDIPSAANVKDTYQYPWLLAVLNHLLWVPLVVVLTGALGSLGVLAVVDRLNLGRVPVAKTGCCRDEDRIQRAQAPGWGRKVAPYLAAAGAVIAMLSPLAGVVFSIPAGYVIVFAKVDTGRFTGPTIGVTEQQYNLIYALLIGISALTYLPIMAVAATAAVGSLVLIFTEQGPVLDDAQPVKFQPVQKPEVPEHPGLQPVQPQPAATPP